MHHSVVASAVDLRSANIFPRDAAYGVLVHSGADGTVLYASAESARMLGYARADDLCGRSFQSLMCDDTAPAPKLDAEQSANDGLFYPEEHRFCRQDGTSFMAEIVTKVVLCNGEQAFQVAILDVSAREAFGRREKEAAALTRMLVDSAFRSVVVVDVQGRITELNSTAEQLLGISKEQSVGEVIDVLENAFDETGRSLRGTSIGVTTAMSAGVAPTSRMVQIRGTAGAKDVWFSSQPLVRAGESEAYGVAYSFDDVTELRNTQTSHTLANGNDELTGLPNRHFMQKQLAKSLEHSRATGLPLALVCIDLDRFKTVNDTYGHSIGDQLLKEVSVRLGAILRGTDWIARAGGDEFVIVLPASSRVQAATVAERVLDRLSQPFSVGPSSFYTGASVGIAMYAANERDATVEDLLTAADTAMFCAKISGRQSYKFFEPSMLAERQELAWLESNFMLGLVRNEFILCYQPKASTATGMLTGVEALVRWKHPQRGMISPTEFIPFAEKTGLIVQLGGWVINEACRQAKSWHDQGFDIPIAVNLSARQLQEPGLPTEVQDALQTTQLPAWLLEIELTESAVANDEVHAVASLNAIRALGVHLSLDDFGTGYSTFLRVADCPVSALKIDLSFINRLTTEEKILHLVSGIVHLAHVMGMYVVAEGVETRCQMHALQKMGCEQVQGFLMSKAVTAADLEARFNLSTPGAVQMFDPRE